MIGSLTISGLLSKVVRKHKGKPQAILFLITKGKIYKRLLYLVNWEGIEESMKYLPFGTKLGKIKFAIRFYGTGKMMKIMGACPSDLFPCFQEETETTLHVIKREQPYMLNVFEKKHSL